MEESKTGTKAALLGFILSIRGIVLIAAILIGIILLFCPLGECLSYRYSDSTYDYSISVSDVYAVAFAGTLKATVSQSGGGISLSGSASKEISSSSALLLIAFLFSLLGFLIMIASLALILIKQDKLVLVLGIVGAVLLFVGAILYLSSMDSIFNIVVGEGYSKNNYHLGGGAIAAGIFGILAALLSAAYAILSLPGLKHLAIHKK